MRKSALTTLTAIVFAISTSLALAGQPAAKDSAKASVTPPVRPAPLTQAQFQALKSTEAAPEHNKLLKSSATYAPPQKGVRWTTVSDDVWTVIYDVGWPGSYLAVALCAI
jgi:hypothetical protein